jgi:HAD superfamily hydrolase (TIGR01509 family)
VKINGEHIDKEIKAIVFDCDGTIMDSELVHLQSYATIAEKYGTVYDDKLHDRFVGTSDIAVSKFLFEKVKENFPELKWEDLMHEKMELYTKSIPTLKTRETIREFIDKVIACGLKVCVASSTAKTELMLMLESADLAKKFPVIIGGDQVENRKPDPSIYLKAAKEIGILPEECAALEDSPAGAESAKRAGMISIAWPHEYTKNKTFVDGVYKIESLDQIEL